jgi:excisionase family DNA binding protein
MICANHITIEEAAKLAKCSSCTIQRAIKRGDLTAYKPGKTVLILEKDFMSWFQSKQIHAVQAGRPRRIIAIHGRR